MKPNDLDGSTVIEGGRNVPRHPWQLSAETLADELQTDIARGLSSAETARRLETIGPNDLVEERPPSVWRLLAHQLVNTMTVVLAVAALVTWLIGDHTDTIVIAVIVALNAAIGFAQEHRAEQAMVALKRLTTDRARVLRDGELRDVPSSELVPGDVVEIVAGDVTPADLRLVVVHGLRVNEASLTGEPEPVAKIAGALGTVAPGLVADQQNMAFRGTVVTYGRAHGVVVATGMATQLGQIAGLLEAHPSGPTPLQRRLAVLGRRLAAAALAVCGAVFAAGIAAGEPTRKMFLTAVSLAVAAVPEGLPAVVTVALALGARRMATRRTIVRRLSAVETLGSVTVICSDKTGTLTEQRMVVERVWTPTGTYTVTGTGYRPEGSLEGADTSTDRHLDLLARVAALCNDAALHAPSAPEEDWSITGDPTEGALLTLAAKLHVERVELERRYPRRAELGFDAQRRRMTTVHRVDGGSWVAVKGALGALAPLLVPDASALVEAEAVEARLTEQGYRVLALAERSIDTLPDPLEQLEHDLHLLGLVAIADPPRPEAARAIAICRAAGITPVMITGDDPRTARAIARRLDLLDDAGDAVLSGRELDALDDAQLAARVASIGVYARTNPEQKLRIVGAWKARGAVVAMTGDGVNDAPALRRADIGVAMGISGSDVSKESADMILADDNFATIVHAVEEGRRIYDNIRRVVRYLVTTNSGEVWVMLLAPLFGLPLPLLPVQILWINLVTDGLPSIALGLEPAEPDTMQRPPREPTESIFARGLWQHSLWVGLLMAAVVLPLLIVTRAAGWPWQTMAFATLALLQLGHALAVRSESESIFRLGLRSNSWMLAALIIGIGAQLVIVYVPPFQDAFSVEPLTLFQLAIVAAASTTVFIAVEIEKWWRRRRGQAGNSGHAGG